MLLRLSWIYKIFSIKYHGVTIHHDTHKQGLCSLCVIHILAKEQEKHEVIQEELSDLFPQLAQT